MLPPSRPDVLVTAVDWVEDLLTGPLGVSIAVLGIAALGLALLQGRIPFSRGATVVVGCFVLFGARAIAAGLIALGAGGHAVVEAPTAVPAPRVPPPTPFDPYAGASVPQQN